MRKQTKLVAVLSAAALLALGASMTSFAAGWEKDEAGIWHYYDADDELVTGEWKKDGGKWFYLDDDGDMATDAWIDDEYYVGEDGAMLVNEWIDNDTRITQGKNAQLDGNIRASQAEAASDSNGKPSVSALLYYEEVEDGSRVTGWREIDVRRIVAVFLLSRCYLIIK